MSQTYSRIAVVTGATSGIGEAIARKLAAAGCAVAGNGRKADRLAALERELGPGFCGVAGDASEAPVLERLLAAAKERFGRPADLVVANAGRGLGGTIQKADLSQLDEMLRINVSGTLMLLQMAANQMTAAPSGFPRAAADIVILGSVVGRNLSPFGAAYSASKFAVHALAESLRRELGPKGIRVTLVEPGVVVSGFQAAASYSDELVKSFHDRFGPLLTPEDVANAVHFVVSQPPHVHLSDIVIRPTRQDYP